MTNHKGARWETAVVNYLNEANFGAERTGSELLDEADIHFGVTAGTEWTVEAKDQQQIDLPAYLRQLEASLIRRNTVPFKGAVVVKNRRRGVGDAYAVMRFERYRQLVGYVILLEQLIAEELPESVPLSFTMALKHFLGSVAEDGVPASVLFSEFIGPDEWEDTGTRSGGTPESHSGDVIPATEAQAEQVIAASE